MRWTRRPAARAQASVGPESLQQPDRPAEPAIDSAEGSSARTNALVQWQSGPAHPLGDPWFARAERLPGLWSHWAHESPPEARPGDQQPPVAGPEENLAGSLHAETQLSRAAAARLVLLSRCRALWTTNYQPLLEMEAKECPELWEHVSLVYRAQTSQYRLRLTDPTLVAKYDLKTDGMIRNTVAVMRRRRNQLDIPFSTSGRSLSYFNQRVPTRVWKDQQRGMHILHRTTCQTLLDGMLETDPGPGFILNDLVVVFCVDQCNHWQVSAHSKKGMHYGAERLNAQGMPVHIRSETVLNVVQRYIPFTSPLLTADEVKLITEKGPYTEDDLKLKAVLNPTEVERNTWDWMLALCWILAPNVQCSDEDSGDADVPPTRALPTTEREVVDRALAKPPNKPRGPTPHQIHPAIPNCETQSYMDIQKMWAYMLRLLTTKCICVVIYCDGQLVELLRSARRHYVEYRRILIGNGHFHSLAHLCFTLITGYWKVPCTACLFYTHGCTACRFAHIYTRNEPTTLLCVCVFHRAWLLGARLLAELSSDICAVAG